VEPNAAPEERVKLLLASDNPQDRQRALALVSDLYRPDLAREFRARFPDFPDQEFTDSWKRVIEQLARLVDKRPFDPNRSLRKSLLVMLAEEPIKGLLTAAEAGQWCRGLELVASLYEQPIHAVLRTRWPDLSADDRANVWQETLGGLLANVRKGSFRREGPLLGYLLGIVDHKVADYYRAKATFEKALGTIIQGRSASTQIDPEKQLEAKEFRRLLGAGIDSLPPRERQVLREYVEGFPETRDMQLLLERVKRVSGKDDSLSSVKVSLSRGKKRLGSYLRGNGYGAEGGDA
jgi:DNA-directed RNA polymerase specialized sigma24 family protein